MQAILITLLLTSLLQGGDAAAEAAAFARVSAYERARIEVIRKAAPAVVCMFNRGSRAGGGSGVIIDEDGYGLTNYHVVAGMMSDRVGDAGMPDGKIYEMEILGIDPTGDVAMFRAMGLKSFARVEMGDSDALAVGDYALAMGNPFLLAEDYTPTVTLGIISGLNRFQAGAGAGGRALRYTDCIQVDTSINPGNSGGPLFDLAGRVIGINGRVSIEDRGRVNVGVGYAISINQIKRFIPALRAGISTRHATAGFTVFDRDDQVIVDQILDDSEAYLVGIELGDRIVSFGGKPIHSANQFGSLLGTYPENWPVSVTWERDGKSQTRTIRLEDLPFPKGQGGPGEMESPDPMKPHAITRAANRRAMKRALRLYRHAIGGTEAASSLIGFRAVGNRVLTSRPRATEPITLSEARAGQKPLKACKLPLEIERAVRWALLDTSFPGAEAGCEVVGGDEVAGRIAVVIACDRDDEPAFKVAFDDADGRLLQISFQDPISRKAVRFEYGDYRRASSMKFPHNRRLYLEDKLFSEDHFEKITVQG